MITKTSYNEGTKLTASFINLMAVGLLTAGVTTPLVSAFYGAQIWGSSVPAGLVVLGSLFWLAMSLVVHTAALLLLRSLIE